ncbi:ABC transporter permease [Sinanaerobacter chloroacetimidivorans]|jgi:spermidine/putrescine transport system permease protein|uniref:ABC transporter permease n=1 Tax=Sinanaerobacter chloroacetimidivorans TaxID=2818044 RepID=A0A8J7W2C3_9FIRM|nr:ABC transporter permease [Sinanaerobacter chloroacetimidivorans]MBR0599607.1 ABC transporter permease [Sinanaerobacter chloroacetimidivorans]
MAGKKREWKRKLGKSISTIYAILVYAFIYAPIAIMVVFSFNDQKTNYYWKGFTLQWYEKLFNHSSIVEYLWNSLFIAVAATLISVIIGTIGAVGLIRFEFRMKKLVNHSLYIPIVIPEVVLGISLLMLFEIIHLPLGFFAIILSHATFCIPFVIIIMRGRLAGMDLSVEEASMDLGANRMVTFFRVTLPMLIPGIISGAFMSFTLSIDDVIISNFVSGPYSTTLPVKILSLVKTGLSPEVNALATLMIAVILLALLLNTVVQALVKRRALTHTKSYF